METIEAGTLYLVSTPIGNLEDLSPRARRMIAWVDLVLAEDTRRTGKLLAAIGVSRPQLSLHEHNELQRCEEILARLEQGEAIALVSDAGTPLVSDPGYPLVSRAVARGIRVVPIPGPSAILAALCASGMPAGRFTFLGFLPRRAGAARRLVEQAAGLETTLVIFESPRRLVATLGLIGEVLGERRVCVARELTKMHEEIVRGPVSEIVKELSSRSIKGEVTLVVEGGEIRPPVLEGIDEEACAMLAQGRPAREVAEILSGEHDLPFRRVYRRVLAVKKGQGDGGI